MIHAIHALVSASLASASFVSASFVTAEPRAQDWFGGGDDLMRALDVNGDGALDAKEIDNAARALRLLDEDGDGAVAGDELTGGSESDWDDWGDWDDDWEGGDWDDFDDWGASGDGTDDENRVPGRVLEPDEVSSEDGTDRIDDQATYDLLSEPGEEILGQPGLAYVKFQLEDHGSDEPRLYFINTKTHPAHEMFMRAIGATGPIQGMRGALNRRPLLRAPDGSAGLFTFSFEMQDAWPVEHVARAFELLQANAPLLRGRLAYAPVEADVPRYEEERAEYERRQIPVMLPEDVYGDIGYLPLNRAVSFGRLRVMQQGERPGVRDVVIYRSLPNEMPRVAGVITSVRQTPLSHVNLRAVQDGVPNAFVSGALEDARIAPLVGKYVRYEVGDAGFELREATAAEVNAHFESLRPPTVQVPARDLSVTAIQSLDAIGFDAADSVGAKAANLAVLRSLELPGDPVPAGFVVPFHFYDAFMKHNELDRRAAAICNSVGIQQDAAARDAALADLRERIKKGRMPQWMLEALSGLQSSFPRGASLRCRSSTNNEDLPGFSGAGLYDSFTHHPDEGHLSKSVKQVFASLWNFRAYEERAFFRVDHMASSMAVLVHVNFKDERSNGVAVSDDVVYGTHTEGLERIYYVNALMGEDLVTNPSAGVVPEELLLSSRYQVDDVLVRSSSQLPDGDRVVDEHNLYQLRLALKRIHHTFRALYGVAEDESFAMEVEFKITLDGRLAIKQARPWVY